MKHILLTFFKDYVVLLYEIHVFFTIGQLPFAVLAKQMFQNSGETGLAIQILAGPVLLILEPELINGSRKMNIILNVEDQFKELIVTPGNTE